MCGINGITKEDHQHVVLMNERIKHRGPDGSAIWQGSGITLGHNRLAIIDVSTASSQPMQSTDGRYVIVYNGELYNFKELKSELNGKYVFKTEGDTEVLLAAYCVWGEKMLNKLRGIFAFAIWDTKEECLLLVRDHMGVKPLYYRIQDGVLSFSSELPALLVGTSGNILDAEALSFYLAMEYVPATRSLVSGVKKLQPGHLLRFKNGKAEYVSYTQTDIVTEYVTEEKVYEVIDKVVHRQLVSDRPVGAYLSGGFDSSIVVHHMAKHSERVRTYSVDFEAVQGEEDATNKFNADAELAAKTAAVYGTDHKQLTIRIQDVRDSLEKTIASANEPVANSTSITQYLLSDFVRKDGTVVVLGGDGGDELFAGYTRHRIAIGAYQYQKLPKYVQALLGKISPRVGKLSTPFFTPLHMALEVKDEKKINPLLISPQPINAQIQNFFDGEYAKIAHKESKHPLDVFMQVDRQTWLADECFIRSDYASMAHGIELRVPLVDMELVSYANAISINRKVLPHQGKRVLRKAYVSHLPEHLFNQPKRGWLSPAAKWFRDPYIKAFAKEVFTSGYYNGLDGVFDWNKVQDMLDAHVEKRGYYLYPLWNILSLQVWARNNGIKSK